MINKKTNLAIALILAMLSPLTSANNQELSKLEIADPDLAGGSYSTKVELAKKVNQLQDLQMDSHQVDTLKNVLLNKERAIASPYTHIATPITRSINIKFASGVTPPVVRLSSNLITTIVFSDSLGNPWNIVGVAYNRDLFSNGTLTSPSNITTSATTQQSEDPTQPQKVGRDLNNILTLEPLNPFSYSNIAITLQGLDQPVILMLASGQNEVDVRVDARISGINPEYDHASIGGIGGGSGSPLSGVSLDDSTLLFVDGTPPVKAQKMKTTSDDIEAWLYGDSLIVRTRQQIIYPSFKSSVTSASGVTVYKFDPTTQSIALGGGINQTKTVFIESE